MECGKFKYAAVMFHSRGSLLRPLDESYPFLIYGIKNGEILSLAVRASEHLRT